MNTSKIPALGYALLGLLMKPSSGYDLRKVFSSTSMKTYSDSPGAIYPALRRLQEQGLIRGKVEEGSGLRRRQIFRLTSKGLAELKKWITSPITREDLESGLRTVMLRFAFSETAVGAAASLEILKSLEAALQPHLQTMREQLQAMKAIAPTSGRLALECGIRSYEALFAWAHYAITVYEKQMQGGPS
ncbi:MAG TPA: PadR family transcriptional regulator [Candidatus Sulfotelmatobacter sp.]|nr:PadR family transcriptional regulator [Candidatus Sulfotelmatobacter sp.]